MKLKTFVLTSILSIGIFLFAIFIATKDINHPDELALAGKKVWQKNNCVSCHALFGQGGYSADDLTHIVLKRKPEELSEYLINPPKMRPFFTKKHLSLDEEDTEKLLEYLIYINEIPTLGWPPEPLNSGEGQ